MNIITDNNASETIAAIVIADEVGASSSDQSCQAACANCGTALSGAYCHACGQSAHIHRSLLHMVEELLHGLFHFDTKAWRTIPAVMFRPGQLTREYIGGKRTSYVSPLALFLFLIFLMFFVSSSLISTSDSDVLSVSHSTGEVRSVGKAIPKAGPTTPTPPTAKAESDFKASDLPEYPRIAKLLESAFKNKQLTLYKMKKNAASLAFLLIPISLPFLWLLFAFRRQYLMFDHAVFALYSLSFMSILMSFLILLSKIGFTETALLIFIIAPPIHMYKQLRHAYQLAIPETIWRTIALMLIALTALLSYAVVVTLYSA